MKKILRSITQKELLLSLLSGLLLGLSWHKPFTFLLFIGFVPLFYLFETTEATQQRKLRYLAYFTFVSWNLIAYWWLYYIGIVAFLFAVLANSFLMLLPTILYQYIKRKTTDTFGIAVFVICWITFEYLHTQDWGFSWTWLNLGNAFGNTPSWVQWYEYVGVFGGSAWALLINYLIFKTVLPFLGQISPSISQKALSQTRLQLALVGVLFIPFGISQWLFYTYQEQGKTVELVALQPNFDTYTQKFTYNARTGGQNTTTYIPFDQQFDIFLKLLRKNVTDKTTVVLLPETAWNQSIDETAINADGYITRMKQVRDSFPNLSVLTGADSYQFYYNTAEKPTPTARYHSLNTHYDVYNSAMFINSQNDTKFYHKSRLVVGVESNPLRNVIGFLQKTVMQNMGNLVGDLGVQSERSVFTTKAGAKLAPVICYESIYGEYVTEYVKKGATVLCVLTNDGWWDDSPAPRQHLSFASLRAIETRRAVVRSANTGISAFINQKGEVTQQSKYNEQVALRNTVQLNEAITFYVRFGDVVALIAMFLTFLCVLLTFNPVKRTT